MALLDGPGFFRNTIIPSVGGGATARRVPFTFTSTARLLKSGKVRAVSITSAKAIAEENQKQSLAYIEAETRGTNIISQLGLGDLTNTIQKGIQTAVGLNTPVIQMAVNPQTIKWSQNKRITKRDTMDGSVFFHFTNSADQNNDILQMTFSGKTGNINTQANMIDSFKTGANLKLRIWHELYNLTREPILLNKSNTGLDLPRGLKNEFFITYRTVLMPIQITLIGHFSQVMEFTESADDPYNRDYSFQFTVTSTNPSLDKLPGMMNSQLSLLGQAQSLGSGITSLLEANPGQTLSGIVAPFTPNIP